MVLCLAWTGSHLAFPVCDIGIARGWRKCPLVIIAMLTLHRRGRSWADQVSWAARRSLERRYCGFPTKYLCIRMLISVYSRSPGIWARLVSGGPRSSRCQQKMSPLNLPADRSTRRRRGNPLVQHRGQKRFLRADRGVAGLALLEAGVQRRFAVVRRAIALFFDHVSSWVSSSSDTAYAIAAMHRQASLHY